MYLTYFGLSRSPFDASPQPDSLFESPSHTEGLASLIYGITQQRGFVAVTGEVGVGKTTTLMAAIKYVTTNQPDLILIEFSNPVITPDAMVTQICERTGLAGAINATSDLTPLRLRLTALRDSGRAVVLIFDEAQSIPPETLEFLRILSNLYGDGTPLLVIIFSGQPELDEVLARPENRALDQRIAIRAKILPFKPREARAYLRFRLTSVGGDAEKIMTTSAMTAVIRLARHVPRRINILADNALIAGFGNNHRPITRADVYSARGVLGVSHRAPLGKKKPPVPLVFTLAALSVAAAALIVTVLITSPTTRNPATEQQGQTIATATPQASQPESVKPQPSVPAPSAPNPPPMRTQSPAAEISRPANHPTLSASNISTTFKLMPTAPTIAPPSLAQLSETDDNSGRKTVESADSSVKTTVYKVKVRDTIFGVLRKYSLPATPPMMQLVRKLNPNFGNLGAIYPGQYVILPATASKSETHGAE